MDISIFDSKSKADAGVRLDLLDPVTKKKTDAAIILFGSDSDVHKSAKREIEARNKAMMRELTPDEREAQSIELLARCTKGWAGLESGGKPILFSQEKAEELYKAYPEIADRVAVFIFSRANFFGKASGD